VKQNISADLLSICTKEIKLLCVAKRIGNTSCNHQPMDYFDRLSTHYGIQKRKKSIFNHPILTSVWFWPSNSKTGYLWPSNYQNRSNLTIGLFWWVVLISLFTIKSLDLKMIITFCLYLRFRTFLRSSIRNGELYLLKYSSYYFITICYIILMLLCKNNNIIKIKQIVTK